MGITTGTTITTSGNACDFEIIRPTYNPAATALSIMGTVSGFANSALQTITGMGFDANTDGVDAISFPSLIYDPITLTNAIDLLEDLKRDLDLVENFDLGNPDYSLRPELSGLSEVAPYFDDVYVPDFSKQAPEMVYPPLPEELSYTMPEEVSVDYVDRPTRPDISYPNEPELIDVAIPEAPSFDIPRLDAELMLEDINLRNVDLVYSDREYESQLLRAIQAGLLSDILNGTYGLDPRDEQQLFERTRDRERRIGEANIAMATRTFSIAGFSMPNGAALKAIQNATNDMNEKISAASREAEIKRAEIYWDGRKFAFSQGTTVEQMLINLHNATMERVLNAAKAQAEVAINYFNLVVARYKAVQERYIAIVQGYEMRVRAETAKAEIYKAQLAGAQTKMELNKALVDIYKGQLEARKIMVDVYKTDVEAMSALLQAEKLKIDVYRALIDAVLGEIQAKKAEYEMYATRINAEVSKMDGFKAEAQAYASVVEGKKIQVDIQRAKLDQWVQENKSKIDAFMAKVENYKADLNAQNQYMGTKSDVYKTTVSLFGSAADAYGKAYQLDAANQEAEERILNARITASLEKAKVELDKILRVAQLHLEADKNKAQTFASVAAAAMSAMNVNASLSGSDSFSQSLSKSCGQSNSVGHTYSWYPDVYKSISKSYTKDITPMHNSTSWSYNHAYEDKVLLRESVNTTHSHMYEDKVLPRENLSENHYYEGALLTRRSYSDNVQWQGNVHHSTNTSRTIQEQVAPYEQIQNSVSRSDSRNYNYDMSGE